MPVLGSKLEESSSARAVNVFRTDIFCCADQLDFNEVVGFFDDAFDLIKIMRLFRKLSIGSQRKFAIDQLTCRIPHHRIEGDFRVHIWPTLSSLCTSVGRLARRRKRGPRICVTCDT
jgi:hypothetical protein